jgi:pyridoxine/pyridoxamine 5'-phosphate oxidase
LLAIRRALSAPYHAEVDGKFTPLGSVLNWIERAHRCQQVDVASWHIASIRFAAKFGRFQIIVDIVEFWRELARSRLIHTGHLRPHN